MFESRSAEHERTNVAKRLCERVIRREAAETEGLLYIYIKDSSCEMCVNLDDSEQIVIHVNRNLTLHNMELSQFSPQILLYESFEGGYVACALVYMHVRQKCICTAQIYCIISRVTITMDNIRKNII